VPGIVGFRAACRLVQVQGDGDRLRMGELRDRLEYGILSQVTPGSMRSGEPPLNTSNIGFKGVDARTMIRDMHDIAVSAFRVLERQQWSQPRPQGDRSERRGRVRTFGSASDGSRPKRDRLRHQ
jgi:hypothetical protein